LNNFTDQPAISVISLNQKKYLKGTRAGDIISIYTINGKKVSTFKSTSELELINGLPGVVLIEVKSGKTHSVIKTVF